MLQYLWRKKPKKRYVIELEQKCVQRLFPLVTSTIASESVLNRNSVDKDDVIFSTIEVRWSCFSTSRSVTHAA